MTGEHRRSRVAFVAVAVLVLALTPTASRPAAEALVRYSGIVEHVDREAGTIVLSEMGRWRGAGGATRIARRIIRVTPATEFVRVERRGAAPAEAWPGGYVEVPLEAGSVHEGQFVTVHAAREGGRLVARRVLIARPNGS